MHILEVDADSIIVHGEMLPRSTYDSRKLIDDCLERKVGEISPSLMSDR